MISTDTKIFEQGSSVRNRMVEYGSLFDELHIVVFTKKGNSYRNTLTAFRRIFPFYLYDICN
jgi:hypothetical protein